MAAVYKLFSLDVDGIVIDKEGKITSDFYDTDELRNGATEAIFKQLSRFAYKVFTLVMESNFEEGCPRCFTVRD